MYKKYFFWPSGILILCILMYGMVKGATYVSYHWLYEAMVEETIEKSVNRVCLIRKEK